MMRLYGCLTINPPASISKLINATSASWDRQKVQAIFLHMDAKVILGIPLCTKNVDDFWSWSHEKNAVFSVKSAYRMLVSTRQRREAWLENRPGPSNSATAEGELKKLWRTEVLGKVRMFLWRLSKHSIPTNDVRAYMCMSTSSACGIFGSPDSWRHSLLECTMARCTWALVDEELAQNLATITEPKAKQWLSTLMNTLSHDLFVKLSVTLWAIWSSHRKAIHEDIFKIPHVIHGHITSYQWS